MVLCLCSELGQGDDLGRMVSYYKYFSVDGFVLFSMLPS